MGKVRVGIIGCGYMAQTVHMPCLRAIEDVEISALCDFRKKVTDEISRHFNVPFRTDSAEELLSLDIDAVFVLTPVQWHLYNIKAALQAGKHVFTEKPAAMSAASAYEISQTAAAARKVMAVGYMKRHDAGIAELKRLQSEDNWGKLLFARKHVFVGSGWNAGINNIIPILYSDEKIPFDSDLLDKGPEWLGGRRDEQFYSFDNPYYGFLDTGSHSINLLRYLTGIDPRVCSVRNISGVKLIDFDFDGCGGTMEFRVNFDTQRWEEITELYFEKASVRILTPSPLDMFSSAAVEILYDSGRRVYSQQTGSIRNWAFMRQAEQFISRVSAGNAFSDMADSVKDLEIIENIYKTENGIKS